MTEPTIQFDEQPDATPSPAPRRRRDIEEQRDEEALHRARAVRDSGQPIFGAPNAEEDPPAPRRPELGPGTDQASHRRYRIANLSPEGRGFLLDLLKNNSGLNQSAAGGDIIIDRALTMLGHLEACGLIEKGSK